VELAIISDTHLSRGNRRLPEDCVERLRSADVIVHAGDFITLAVLRELQELGRLVAVHGNVDDQQLRVALPETRVLRLDGVRIGIVHDAGPAQGRLERLRKRFPDADAVVFGHSHMPLHESAADGFQIFNPGSPTERRRAPEHTMGIARVHGGGVEFELRVVD
jgi:putative phosphoesterase